MRVHGDAKHVFGWQLFDGRWSRYWKVWGRMLARVGWFLLDLLCAMSFSLFVDLGRCVRPSDNGEFHSVFFKTGLSAIGMTGGLFTRVAQERAGCSTSRLRAVRNIGRETLAWRYATGTRSRLLSVINRRSWHRSELRVPRVGSAQQSEYIPTWFRWKYCQYVCETLVGVKTGCNLLDSMQLGVGVVLSWGLTFVRAMDGQDALMGEKHPDLLLEKRVLVIPSDLLRESNDALM